MEIENAYIEKVSLTMADHGCLTWELQLKLQSGGGCCYGGYCIGHGYLGAKEFKGYAKGNEAIMRIMDVVGVDRWENMKGKYCRVETHGCGGIISKIGNIMEEKWFDAKTFFDEPEHQ